MDRWLWWLVGLAVYALIGWGCYELLAGISGSADMTDGQQLAWAATWPLIPLYLLF